MNKPTESAPAAPRRILSLGDAVSLIVGIVIGTGIFIIPAMVAGTATNSSWMMICWGLGGLVSLAGAMCYAELMSRFPTAGGDYQFLTQCYGRKTGFVFAWTQFWVVRPGSIGSMAYIFADSAQSLFAPNASTTWTIVWAIALIVLVTGLNLLGLRVGKNTQNLLTLAKVTGLLTVFIAALLVPDLSTQSAEQRTADTVQDADVQDANVPNGNAANDNPQNANEEAAESFLSGAWAKLLMISGALIFVLFAFGGWTDIAFVGAEVRNPEKNAIRAMAIGVLAITAIYLLMNVAYLRVLGFEGIGAIQAPNSVAAATADISLGDWGARFVSALILVSSAGALNGVVLTGSRIYYAFGRDHAMFTWLGKWHPRYNSPLNSLVMQGFVTCCLTALFGSRFWAQLFVGVDSTTFAPKAGFERMVYYTTPGYWFFVVLVVLSLFYYRRRQTDAEPHFRVPGFPFVPIFFCLVCLGVIYSSLTFAIEMGVYEAVWSAGFVVLGLGVSFFSKPPKKQTP